MTNSKKQTRVRGAQQSGGSEQEPTVNPNGRADIAGSTPGGMGGDVDKAFGPAGQQPSTAPSGVAVPAGRGSADGPLGVEAGDLASGSLSGGIAGGLGGGLDSSDVGGASTGMQNDLSDTSDAAVGDQQSASDQAPVGGSHDMARGEKGSGRAQVAPEQRPAGRKPPKQ
jgi:hypothetical protein